MRMPDEWLIWKSGFRKSVSEPCRTFLVPVRCSLSCRKPRLSVSRAACRQRLSVLLHSPARIDKRNYDGGAGHRLAIDEVLRGVRHFWSWARFDPRDELALPSVAIGRARFVVLY
jgi:hypothetical protein